MLCLTPFLPYDGVSHAGGEFVRQYLKVATESHDVTIMAPAWESNAGRASAVDPALGEVVVVGGTVLARRWARPVARVLSFVRGLGLGSDFGLALRIHKAHRESAHRWAVVDLQYSEAGSYASWFRRFAPQARLVLVVHDVIAQRWRRRLTAEGLSLRSLLWRIRAKRETRAELRAVNAVDLVVVLNEKDESLLRSLGCHTSIVVLHPMLEPPRNGPRGVVDAQARRREGRNVVFIGAFNRTENCEGVRWFINRVWDNVVSQVPDATLTLAGAHPPEWLVKTAHDRASIRVTGYVDDLETVYDEAAACIVPLFQGAGVKFKTISAMLRAIPVIATPVGAEGVGDESCFMAVTGDPNEFARGVVTSLIDHQATDAVVASAMIATADRFDPQTFRRGVLKILTGDIPGTRGTR